MIKNFIIHLFTIVLATSGCSQNSDGGAIKVNQNPDSVLKSLARLPADSLNKRTLKMISPKIQLKYIVRSISGKDTLNPDVVSLSFTNIKTNDIIKSGCLNDEGNGCFNIIQLNPGDYKISVMENQIQYKDSLLSLDDKSLYELDVYFINKMVKYNLRRIFQSN